MMLGSCTKDDPEPTPTPTPTPIENVKPTAYGTIDNDNGKVGDTFYFNASESSDPEGKPMTYMVDVDGDGTYDTSPVSTNTKTSHVYNQAINANPRIKVTDDQGKFDVYNVGKVGIWETDADKPQVKISSQNYVIAGQPMNVGVEVTEPNGLSTENDIFYNNQNKQNIGSGTQITPGSDLIGSDLELRVRSNTKYHIEGETTKTVKVGSPIPADWNFTAPNGDVYGASLLKDGKIWMTRNYDGELGEHYNNDSENKIFGKYLNASQVDELSEKLKTMKFKTPDNREFEAYVPTSEEWIALSDAYGGGGIGSADLKYKEFANGENVGATNESGLSLMLGGSTGTVGFLGVGDKGVYMTSTGNGSGSKKAYKINKDNSNITNLDGFPITSAGNVRLIIKNE